MPKYAGSPSGGQIAGGVTFINEFNGITSESFQRDTMELTGRATYQRRIKVRATQDAVFGNAVAFRSA